MNRDVNESETAKQTEDAVLHSFSFFRCKGRDVLGRKFWPIVLAKSSRRSTTIVNVLFYSRLSLRPIDGRSFLCVCCLCDMNHSMENKMWTGEKHRLHSCYFYYTRSYYYASAIIPFANPRFFSAFVSDRSFARFSFLVSSCNQFLILTLSQLNCEVYGYVRFIVPIYRPPKKWLIQQKLLVGSFKNKASISGVCC